MRHDRASSPARCERPHQPRVCAVLAGAVLVAFVVASPAAHGETTLVRAARVYPVSSPPIEDGEILIRDGAIVEVGAQVGVGLSLDGVRVIDVAGSVMPGLIDGSTPMGIGGRTAEEFSELTPEVRALDGVDLDSRDFELAFRAGVTTVGVSAGPRNVIGGLGGVLRTGPGPLRAGRAVLLRDAFLAASASEQAASGNAPLRSTPPITPFFRIPTTRMGTVFLLRKALNEAAGEAARGTLTAALTPLGRALVKRTIEGELPLQIFVDDEQEILTVLRLFEEPRLRLTLVGASEAASSLQLLKSRRVSVLLYAGTHPKSVRPEIFPQYTERLPALLHRTGIPFAFFSGSPDESRRLREDVACAVRAGLDEGAALEALTLSAARILGIDARVGSLEPGKDADIVAIGGDPLEVAAPILWVMSGGVLGRMAVDRRF